MAQECGDIQSYGKNPAIKIGDLDLKVWELVFYSLDSSSQCLLLLFLPCAAFPLICLEEPYEIGTEF